MEKRSPSQSTLFQLVIQYGRPHVNYYVAGTFLQFGRRITQMIPAFVIGVAFDATFSPGQTYALPFVPGAWIPTTQMGQLWFTAGLVLIAFGLQFAFSVLAQWIYADFVYRTLHDLRTGTYDAVQRNRLQFFDDTETGEVMSILNNDVNFMQNFLQRGLGTSLENGSMLVAMFAFMAVINWQLALVLAVVPLTMLRLYLWISNVIRPKYETSREMVGRLNARLQHNLDGIDVLKASTAEPYESDRVRRASRSHRDAHWDAVSTRLRIDPATDVVLWGGYTVMFLLGGYWVLQGPPLFFTGTMTAGGLVTYLMYARQFNEPLREAAGIVIAYEMGRAASERISSVLEPEKTITDPANPIVPEEPRGTVEYENVTFAYDGAEEVAIDRVDFTVEAGTFVGIAGPTGAGKSTLLKLLPRLYEVDTGSVRVDGIDVRDWPVKRLRSEIGYVSQEPFLFSGTVKENIAYGDPGADRTAIERAATRANAHEFVVELPEGYDTRVGERGVKLSGGQRQRIAIARAILQDPTILVLDEATSHVDNETERLVKEGLAELTRNRTTFVVAHRLSTIRDADRILLLEDGRIVERGDHETLLAQEGLYANLWNVQVGEVEALPASFLERARGQWGEAER